jgi:MOSC domain-containing protein YiiM
MRMSGRAYLYQISISNGGVPKPAVQHARVTTEGVEGDRQRNLTVHGGPNRAVCLYAIELIEALRAEGHSIAPGATGEN